jgi:hypothetical protein
VWDIIRHIARQRKKPQVASFHRTGDIMVERPAQLSRADCMLVILCAHTRSICIVNLGFKCGQYTVQKITYSLKCTYCTVTNFKSLLYSIGRFLMSGFLVVV